MPDGRAPMWRGVALLVAVSLTAAACSSAPPVGAVGSTLPAMNGTVTLDKVIAPAIGAQGFAAPAGFKLVAVVVTAHSPTAEPGKFGAIYTVSKLLSSVKAVAHAKSTVKFPVSDCAAYTPFGTLAPGASQTGCLVFLVPLSAIPSQLKIEGKSKASWLIAESAIQPGTPTAAPRLSARTTTTTAVTGNTGTGVTGNTGAAVTTTTAVTGNTGTATTTTAVASTVAVHKKQRHHPAFTILPKIRHAIPRRGFAGTQVTITGRRLSPLVLVTFNGLPARVVHNTAEKIVVTVPTGATTGPIVVTTATGSATGPKLFEGS